MFTVDFNIGEDPIGPLPNEDIVGKCIDEFYGDEYKNLKSNHGLKPAKL